jgi:hypothetical protein
VNAAVVQSRKPIQQDLCYYLFRWRVVCVAANTSLLQSLSLDPVEALLSLQA